MQNTDPSVQIALKNTYPFPRPKAPVIDGRGLEFEQKCVYSSS
jgi:hypothetical protein